MSRWRLGPPMLQKSVTWKDSLTATRTRSMMTRRSESGPNRAAERVRRREAPRAVLAHVVRTQESVVRPEEKTTCRNLPPDWCPLNPDGVNR